MSKLDTHEYDWLRHIFNGVAIPNLNSTGGATSLWLGMHTADPGDAGSTSAEGGYAAYTRIAVDRSTDGWVVSSNPDAGGAGVSPVGNIDFPQNSATSTGTFTHATVYTSSNISSSGALYNGSISPTINFAQNVTPRLTTGSSITED